MTPPLADCGIISRDDLLKVSEATAEVTDSTTNSHQGIKVGGNITLVFPHQLFLQISQSTNSFFQFFFQVVK